MSRKEGEGVGLFETEVHNHHEQNHQDWLVSFWSQNRKRLVHFLKAKICYSKND